MRFVLRQTFATARDQKGTRSTPGTSLMKKDGRNSQCQPSNLTIMAATPRSSRSSAGDIAPATNAGNTAICRMSATMASAMAVTNCGPGKTVMDSSDIVVWILDEMDAVAAAF